MCPWLPAVFHALEQEITGFGGKWIMKSRFVLPSVIEWDDRYKVGVERLDRAHQELFTIINRLYKLLNDGGRDKWACEQTIKYLKNYTLQHFNDEEAYMASINDTGLPVQQAEHAKLRDVVLPRLERHLVTTDYADGAIEKFVKVCFIWLDKHIRSRDRFIGVQKSR